ncbi:MAG TPA: Gfo/Idh/MocA family oxidoreductase [Steroidobacteraceae bacterium]|jgi:predicted dehydrogenase|nr:Gfo/Idh/MocA family oxidoreductase [Steroidobacteraceae bacterium]
MTDKRIRYGMVGGGQGAFIGAIHRMAMRLEGRYDLVAGAFSSNPDRGRAAGAQLGTDADRVYDTYEGMARSERSRPDGIEAVVIVTPNHLHYPVAKAFLEAGIHVICDKPLTSTLGDALALRELVTSTGKLFFVTYTYGTYPMVSQAREMVRSGQLGTVRVVQVEYAQGWLSTAIEAHGSPQARWRTDPALAGPGGCLGDIGTHAYHLVEYVTGLRTHSVAADLTRFVPGRRLDDNVQVMLRFVGGAKGSLWASQVAAGEDNALRIRVYGDRASICWDQEHPEELRFAALGSPPQILRRGGAGVGPWATGITQLPVGHPEGTLEGFGLLYSEVADAIIAVREQRPAPAIRVATIAEGVAGMQFIDACVRSAQRDAAWVALA